jgi:hypothetical protein
MVLSMTLVMCQFCLSGGLERVPLKGQGVSIQRLSSNLFNMNEWSKAQGAGKGDLFQLTIGEPQRWGTRVFSLGGFLENHWGDPAVLKILRLEIKAANISLLVRKVNSLDPWAQGQILPPSSDGTDWPPVHPDTPLIKMIALAKSSHQLVQ